MSLIEKIKAKYPNPRALVDDPPLEDGNYCVGGAVCLYHHSFTKDNTWPGLSFPDTKLLSRKLIRLNPDLPSDLAFTYANLITFTNDEGRFAEAWSIADSALEYKAAQDIG